MAYAVTTDAREIDCIIPVSDLGEIAKEFYEVLVRSNEVELTQFWEEDGAPITGKIVGESIVLNDEHHGTYNNSSDGGLVYLLTKYKGSGIIEDVGEDGSDHAITKYVNGVERKGRIVFDDEETTPAPTTAPAPVRDVNSQFKATAEDFADDDDYPDFDDEEYEEISEEDEEADRQIIRDSGIIEAIATLNGIMWQESTQSAPVTVLRASGNKTAGCKKRDRFSGITQVKK